MSSDAALRSPIALCLIVRDEEEVLPRCLASAWAIAAEIVVVDTGSTDRTIAIAEAAGARVLRVPWADDFAAARNASLDAATRPWALVLDADEELVVADPARLGAILDALGAPDAPAGYLLPIENVLGGGRTSRAEVFRLFRRDLPEMRYRGALHEQVIAVADQRVRTGRLAGLAIRHHGYAPEVIERKDKRARNRRLAEAVVAARPSDPFAWFCLGMEQPGIEARVATYRKALALAEAGGPAVLAQTWAATLVLQLAGALVDAGDRAEAIRVVEIGLRNFPGAPDLLLLRARTRLATGDATGALADAEGCIAAEGRTPPIAIAGDALACEVRTVAGMALARLGRLDAAEARLREAAARAPAGHALAHRLLGLILLDRGRPAEAIEPLRRALTADEAGDPDGSLRRALARALLAAGRIAEGLHELAAVGARGDTPAALQRAVLDLLAAQPPDRAAAILAEWHRLGPSNPDACYWLGYVALGRGQMTEAVRLFRLALAAAPDHRLAREGLSLLGVRS